MSHLLARSDARRIPLPDGCVQACITSPPYYSLRDYGTATWVDGDPGCDHVEMGHLRRNSKGGIANADGRGDQSSCEAVKMLYRDVCRKCGARRVDLQLGLEDTPAAYVAGMVAAFREVRRVLRLDGCLFINVGDSYASAPPGNTKPRAEHGDGWGPMHPYTERQGEERAKKRDTSRLLGLKPKDLIGIPWALAFALRDDGWWLRDAAIWSKADVDDDDDLDGSAMPGSQKDRCTFAYEMVFQLAKSPRYFFDGEAIKTSSGAMMRNVWRINTESFPGSHFAVMPRKLAETCIKAGTSERGCCPTCGRAWERVVERSASPGVRGDDGHSQARAVNTHADRSIASGAKWYAAPNRTNHLGWSQACPCPAREPVPCLVLDPFSGVSTTGVAALALGRRYIGFDLSAEYLAMSRCRIERPHLGVRKKEKAHPLFAALEEPA